MCAFPQKSAPVLVTTMQGGGEGGGGLSADSVSPLSLDSLGTQTLLTKYSPICCYSCAWLPATFTTLIVSSFLLKPFAY